MDRWTNKYEPIHLNEIIGHSNEINKARIWIESFINEVPKCKKILIISGKSGIGKNTLAKCLLNDYGYKIKEYQCQNIKGKNINKILKNTINYTNILDCFTKKKKFLE